MAAPGKGGGKRKVFYQTTCLAQRHGVKGIKSTSSTWFVTVPAPKATKISKHTGCPYCRAERLAEKKLLTN